MTRLLLACSLLLTACASADYDVPIDSDADTDAATTDPVVDLAVSPSALVEAPPSSVTFTLTLDRDPPAEGVRVYVLGDVPQSLTQGNLFGLAWTPAESDGPTGDLTFSGFTFLLTGREGTVTLPSFDDGTEEAPVTVTYDVVPFDEVPWGETAIESEPAAGAYVVGNGTATLELRDAP